MRSPQPLTPNSSLHPHSHRLTAAFRRRKRRRPNMKQNKRALERPLCRLSLLSGWVPEAIPSEPTHPLLASRGWLGSLRGPWVARSATALDPPRGPTSERDLLHMPWVRSQHPNRVKTWGRCGRARAWLVPRPPGAMTGRTMAGRAVSDGRRLHAWFRGFAVLERGRRGFPQDRIRRAWEAVACPNGNEDARGEQGVQWAAPACRWPRVASIPA